MPGDAPPLPLSLRLLKSSFNAEEDGITGLQQLSHDATLLFYMSEEGQEGRNAYQEGRKPDFDKFPTVTARRAGPVVKVSGARVLSGREGACGRGRPQPPPPRHPREEPLSPEPARGAAA